MRCAEQIAVRSAEARNALVGRRVRQIEAEPVPDLRRPRCADVGAEAVGQLLRDLVRRIAVADPEPAREEIPEHAVREVLTDLQRPRLHEVDDVRHQIEPVLELVEQPRLADSRLADDRHHPRHRPCGDLVVLTLEDAELPVAAHHPGLDAFDAARRHPERSGLRRVDDVDAQRLRLALHVNRVQRGDVEDAADVPVGVVRDENTADRRRLLQARTRC